MRNIIKKTFSPKSSHWHVFILAKVFLIVGIVGIVLLFMYSAERISFLQKNAQFIDEKNTSIVIHSREFNEISESIIAPIIDTERLEQLKEICQKEITITSGNDDWTVICETKNEGKKIISSNTYKKPGKPLSQNREFQKVIRNIKTSENVIFYVNVEKALGNIPKLYHGLKKEVPKYIKAFGGTIKKTGKEIRFETFLSLAIKTDPQIIRNYSDASILQLKKENASFFITGNSLNEIIKSIINTVEIKNLPLAIELKNSINRLQKELFLDELGFETTIEMFEGPFLFQVNDDEKSISYISRNKNLPVQQIISAIQKKSKYMNPQRQYFTLPDKTTGAETVTRKEAEALQLTNERGILTSINLQGTDKKPAILEMQNQTIIASSESEIMEIIQEEKSDQVMRKKYNFVFGFKMKEDIFRENEVLKKLLGFAQAINGGITFVKDGIFADLILEL